MTVRANGHGAGAVIADAMRTPFGRRGGGLASTHAAELLGAVLAALLERSGVEPASIDAVVCGCAEKAGEQAFNVPRTAWLAAGLPPSVPALTVDTQCGSSQEAVSLAHALIVAGQADAVIACGVESMSRVPLGHTFVSGPGDPIPDSYRQRHAQPDQFASAEALAARYGVTREACDALAARSNDRAAEAWRSGAFADQVVAVDGVAGDECVRATTSAALAELAPLAPDAVHTKASASKIADGASAVLLLSPQRAAREGIEPLATIVDSILVGVDPELMLSGPIEVTPRLLARNGVAHGDVAHWEVNEAFAAVVLSWAAAVGVDPLEVNPQGGAIAMGHPIGATGTALVGRAAHALRRLGDGIAVVTMCCGGALGTGTLLVSGTDAGG